jgi:hypothetical protein
MPARRRVYAERITLDQNSAAPALTPVPTPTPSALPSDVVPRADPLQPTPAVVTTTIDITEGQIDIRPLEPNAGNQLTLVGQEDPVTFCNSADSTYQDCSIIPLEQLKAKLATATQPLRREEVRAIASVLELTGITDPGLMHLHRVAEPAHPGYPRRCSPDHRHLGSRAGAMDVIRASHMDSSSDQANSTPRTALG